MKPTARNRNPPKEEESSASYLAYDLTPYPLYAPHQDGGIHSH